MNFQKLKYALLFFGFFISASVSAGSGAGNFHKYFKNLYGTAVEIHPVAHDCIHHPEYFKKTIKPNETVKVTLKVMDNCIFNPYVDVCVRRPHEKDMSCSHIDTSPSSLSGSSSWKIKQDGRLVPEL